MRALMLAGLILCTTVGFAAETRADLASEGKKRNEEAFEKMLEQTGWKNENTARDRRPDAQPSRRGMTDSSQPKSS